MTGQRLRIGVLGAAEIARAFIKAVAGSRQVVVTTVASRTIAKAQAFAAETGLANAHGSYEALLADPAIDAIYNPLPNGLHAIWTIKALEAGKHVLCEKPLAATEAEARAMFAAATKAGRHLVEAYPYLAQPMTREVVSLVRSGAIGRPQLIRASFGIPFSDPANIRLQADLAGGAVMDVGSYAASFVRVMAGRRPLKCNAFGVIGATGVDMNVTANFDFGDGLLGQVGASFTTGYHRHGQIAGDKGSIETMYLNHPPIGGPAEVRIRRGVTALTPIEHLAVPEGNGFLAEADSFAALVESGDPAAWTGATAAESIDIAAMLAGMIESAKTGRTVSLT
jgi:D-xylose 1-dehydrogenase (NADP+, D-xylono-1,5-lactone-forming)